MTAAENWIVIATGDHVTSEVRLVPANDPSGTQILVAERAPEREYDVDEHEGWLYLGSLVENAMARIPVPGGVSP